MAAHAIRIGFDTRQECEGVRGLSHQHLATVEDSTSESNCSVEQFGAHRPIDDVRDPQARVERRGVERSSGMADHPDRRCVDDAVARRQVDGDLIDRQSRCARGRKGRGDARTHIGSAIGINICDAKIRGTGGGECVRHGGTRPSCPGKHHSVQGGVGQTALQCCEESTVIGVVADQKAVVDDNRVDSTEQSGIVGQFVECVHDNLLARMGDVQSGEAGCDGAPHHLAGLFDRDRQVLEVYQFVAVIVESEC